MQYLRAAPGGRKGAPLLHLDAQSLAYFKPQLRLGKSYMGIEIAIMADLL